MHNGLPLSLLDFLLVTATHQSRFPTRGTHPIAPHLNPPTRTLSCTPQKLLQRLNDGGLPSCHRLWRVTKLNVEKVTMVNRVLPAPRYRLPPTPCPIPSTATGEPVSSQYRPYPQFSGPRVAIHALPRHMRHPWPIIVNTPRMSRLQSLLSRALHPLLRLIPTPLSRFQPQYLHATL